MANRAHEQARQIAGQKGAGEFKTESHPESVLELTPTTAGFSLDDVPRGASSIGKGRPVTEPWVRDAYLHGIALRNDTPDEQLAVFTQGINAESSFTQIEEQAAAAGISDDAAFEAAELIHYLDVRQELPHFPHTRDVPNKALARILAAGISDVSIEPAQPSPNARGCYTVNSSGVHTNVRLTSDGTVECLTNSWQPEPHGPEAGVELLAQKIETQQDQTIMGHITRTLRVQESSFDPDTGGLSLSLGLDASNFISTRQAAYATVDTNGKVTYYADAQHTMEVENDRGDVDDKRLLRAHRQLVSSLSPSAVRATHRPESRVNSFEKYVSVFRDVQASREPWDGELAQQAKEFMEARSGRPCLVFGPHTAQEGNQ